ncbi:phosphate ABC transporter permease, partial [Vibrio lentus]
MASAQFSLKERDKKRWLKDRLVRFSVTCGAVSVLAALVLIFVYLAMVILPVFSDTGLETDQAVKTVAVEKPIALSVDEYGQHAFTIEKSGLVQFWDLESQNTHSYFERNVLANPIAFSRNTPSENWFAFADSASNLTFFHPEYSAPVLQKGSEAEPKIEQIDLPEPFLNDESSNGATIEKFAFSKNGRGITVAAQLSDQRVLVKWYQSDLTGQYVFQKRQWLSDKLGLQQQLLVTPDGQTLYLRTQSDLVVLKLSDSGFNVREVIDLSLNDAKHSVKSIDLLSGAYSLLVTHEDGQVSQWFDVLNDEKRSLTHIRDFQLAEQVQFILPDTYRKGFYSFYKNGTLQSHYTTSEKLSLFERAFDKSPQLAAMSANELHLATLIDGTISVAKVDNEYPQISFSSLWQKVWYESYPEPQYVWQSTSANDDFEEKFSLVPITFGTIKAALFAMMFAVPVAVLGAIYTAYFMSPRMRRVVKPSIELMEALPTVIIGFLAGLWFAPIVETHLTAVFSLIVLLPLS